MKHTTLIYDPVLGARTTTIDVPDIVTPMAAQQQALNTLAKTREAIVKKQRANNGHNK
ncbi:MAG: hypothetical protein KBS86_00150 [Proteobacteria bacterium]|nr:hypothetical protein [Candidatus Enterousia scatequi]